MFKILIVYGTTDGHTKKVANRIAQICRDAGGSADVFDSKRSVLVARPENFDGVIVAASVHRGRYQGAVTQWVRRQIAGLKNKPTAFVSVCLGVLQQEQKVKAEVAKILRVFFEKTGWQPISVLNLAGAIPYTRYNFFKKWIMKRIARKTGGGMDLRLDYEYTNWTELEEFIREFLLLHIFSLKHGEIVHEAQTLSDFID